jgi:hypothetical protein
MDKVYLVLRNNQQTGPFTIGELLQQQLKPTDMIWVEGKSTAWTYLSELELLPFVKASVQEQQKSIQPKSADEIEKKAEELRQKILFSAPKTYFPQHVPEIETYASPYNLPEEDIQFVDHRKERRSRNNTVIGELALTGFVVGLFMVGIYKGQSFLSVKKQVPNSVATQLNSNDAHAAQKNTMKQSQSTPEFVAVDSTQLHDTSLVASSYRSKPLTKKGLIDTNSGKPEPVIVPATTSSQEEKKEETKVETAIKAPDEIPVKKEVVSSIKETEKVDKDQEKKGFLKGLFKKKKKEETRNDKGE